MAPKINPSKLLPSSSLIKKGTAIIVADKRETLSTLKTISISSAEKKPDEISGDSKNEELNEIHKKLLILQKLFGSELKSLQSKSEGTRKEKEKKEFEEGEKKLEAPKIKGLKLPTFRVPGTSFLGGLIERIKRFIFFTALGWLFPKIIEFLPKLKWIADVIGGVYKFAEGLFGKLFNGFMSLVKFGGDLKDKTIGFLAQLKGGDYQKEFTKLENLFNTFTNASIIAGVLALDIGLAALDQLNKAKKAARKPSGVGGAPSLGYKYDPKRALIRKKYGDSAAKIYDNLIASGKNSKQAHDILQSRYIKKGKIKPQRMMGSLGGTIGGSKIGKRGILAAPKRFLIRKFGKFPKKPKLKAPSWWTKITGAVSSKFSKFASKLSGPFKKFASAAVPGLGAAVGFMDMNARSKSGDKLGAFLAGLSASLDTFTAAVAIAGMATAATGVGLPFATALGAAAAAAGTISMAIDAVLLIRDLLKAFGVPAFAKGGRIVNDDEKDTEEVTRGGRYVNRPVRRTLKAAVIKKPPRIAPVESSPGKDVGGELKIQRLFPSPEPTIIAKSSGKPSAKKGAKKSLIKQAIGSPSATTAPTTTTEDRPNPFNVLTSTAKTLKEIPLIGGIMGSGVDLAMGQKIDSKRIVKPFSSAIKYLVDTLTIEGVNFNITSLFNDMKAFNEGGVVPPSRTLKRDLFDVEGLLNKILGPIIQQKVNEAIQNIQNELKKKGELLGAEGGGKEGEGDLDVEGGVTVTGGNADFWTLVAVASLENSVAQGRADVAQAIYNRVASKANFGQKENTIKGHILAPGQFQPVTYDGADLNLWKAIKDKESAIAAVESHKNGRGRGAQLIESSAAAITNKALQQSAAEFVGGRTDFAVPSAANKSPGGFGYVTRHNHLFGWYVGPGSIAYGKTNPGPARVPQLGNVRVMGRGKSDEMLVSGGRISRGDGKFIQGNSGRSGGVHFHIGTTKPGDPSGPASVAFKVIKYFLGKKKLHIGRSWEDVDPRSTDDEIRGYISRGQAAHRQTEIDIQVGPMQGLGNRVPFPFKLKKLTYSETDGYGTSADIVGAKAFVGHGRYKPDGTLAKQQKEVLSAGPPDYYYEKGGLTKSYPHIAMLAEKGPEFVIDADSTASIEKFLPGLLHSINKAKGYGAVKALFNYFRKPKPKVPRIKTQKVQLPEYQTVTSFNSVAKSKPRIPDVRAFASYESYAPTEENTNVTILPVIVKQPIPISQNSRKSESIMFPVPVSVEVNTIDSFRQGRGY